MTRRAINSTLGKQAKLLDRLVLLASYDRLVAMENGVREGYVWPPTNYAQLSAIAIIWRLL